MSILGRIALSMPKPVSSMTRLFHAIPNSVSMAGTNATSMAWSLNFVRTKVRNRFPKPREVKRMKVHSWWARLLTPNGKKIIMRRMLKGKHQLAPGW